MLRDCLLTTSLLFCVFMGYSQVQIEQTEEKNVLPSANQQIEEKIEPETQLTLEEQGFKLIQLENKIIYRKVVNGIIIEFKPEEK